MAGISFAFLDTLTCLKPEDVGGDEPKLEIKLESELWEKTAGPSLDQINKQLENMFRVKGGFDVSPQIPNKGAVLVWRPSKKVLPIKANEKMLVRWVFPFIGPVKVKLIERDGGFLDPDDKLGTRQLTAESNGKGAQSLEWKGGSGLTSSRFHYKLSYSTGFLPSPTNGVVPNLSVVSNPSAVTELANQLGLPV